MQSEKKIFNKIKPFLIFISNYYIIIISFLICVFLVFYNLGKIEFWGEDEAQTLLYASRFLMGLKSGSLSNLTALYQNITFSSVILIQVPFILLFGVTELAARFSSAIIVILTLFVLYKIGTLFLDKKSSQILALIYSFSGAAGLFKSAIGVGFYIFFILLGFYKIEKFLFHKEKKVRNSDFIIGILCVSLSLIFVPDAFFFLPYFFIIVLIYIKRIGIKTIILSLIAPIFILAEFIYLQFIKAKELTGIQSAAYTHFISRKESLVFVFNFKDFLLELITNYSIFFTILFFISIIIIIFLIVRKEIKFPGLIWRIILLFSVHIIIWMFLTKKENGHLMNEYPIFLIITVFATKSLIDYLNKNNIKSNLFKIFKYSFIFFVFIIFSFNFYHTFTLFNNLSLDKSKYFAFYAPGKVPAGYISARKVGIKSAAYLLRNKAGAGENLVSDKGTAFSFIYMGGEQVVYSTSNAIEYLIAGEDIYKKYRIRFIGISSDFKNRKYFDYINSQGFDRIIVMQNGKPIYYILDVLKKEKVDTIIGRDQFDNEYNRTFAKIENALPFFKNF